MLSLIGIGLGDEHDITLKGLDAIKTSKKIYLEAYTSRLVNFSLQKLEKIYGKKITLLYREDLENNTQKILEEARHENIALLIIGNCFSATTHIDLYTQARHENIPVRVIENASILNAIGITGLSLYKFGRTTTIPKDNENVKSPYDAYLDNKSKGLHTLFLLDIHITKNETTFMTAREGLEYLYRMGMPRDKMVILCGGIGGNTQDIVYGPANTISISERALPQCIIVPGILHFKEEEALLLWKPTPSSSPNVPLQEPKK